MNAVAKTTRRIPGFRFEETMTGFLWLDGVRRAMEFSVRAEAEDAWAHLQTGRAGLLGTVRIDGLCVSSPLHGTLWIDLPRLIRYEFSFRADDGRALRFVGQKDLQLRHPLRTISVLPGEVQEDSGLHKVLGQAQLRFRFRTLPAFLGSFRPLF